MTTPRIAIQPELIKWAILRSGKPESELRARYRWIGRFEQESVPPTLRQLEQFAKATHTPFGYLFLRQPPTESVPLPDFRTIADSEVRAISPELHDTINKMLARRDFMRDYRIELGWDPLPFVGKFKGQSDVPAITEDIRHTLSLAPDWASNAKSWLEALKIFRGRIEKSGILVFKNSVVGNNNSRHLDVQEFRGFVVCDEFAPLVFVNSADAKSAQMFSMAHELVHIWLGQDGLFNLPNLQPNQNAIEKTCNKVAAELLLEGKQFTDVWENFKSLNDWPDLISRLFKVSPIVAVRRAFDLKLIGKGIYRKLLETYFSREYSKPQQSGGNFYANQIDRMSESFARAITTAVSTGTLLYRDAYNLTDLAGSTYDKFAKTVEQGL